MTTPDTTTPEATIEENAAATAVVEAEPAAPAATSEAKAEIEAPASEAAAEATVTETMATEATTEVAAPAAAATAVATEVAAPAAEEDPQTTVFSLITFFLAALPIVGVILNSIAVARAGKEGFDLWLARWGLALAIIETVGALALVGLGYYLGLLTAGAA